MRKSKGQKKFIWAFTTYFAEGFPYSIVRQISSVFFKDHGASLQAIGLTSLYGLPWVLKFLWAPFVDEFSTKRSWLLLTELCVTGAIILIAVGSTLPNALPVVAFLFLITAIMSATHDISVDGFYLENMNREEQAKYVGFQAMSYRIALVVGGGGIIFVSGITDWWAAFLLAAVVFGGLLLFHSFYLPNIETKRKKGSELLFHLAKKQIWLTVVIIAAAIFIIQHLWQKEITDNPSGILATYFRRLGFPGMIVISLFFILIILAVNLKRIKRKLYSSKSFYALAFVDYLDQPKIAVILSFIVLYRTGESFILNMLYPFLKDIGITRTQYGIAYGTFGILASIIGGLTGGKLISKYGLKKVIWPLVLSQNVLNLFYMFLAFFYQDTLVQRAVLKAKAAQNIISHLFNYDPGSLLDLTRVLHSLQAEAANINLISVLVVVEAFGAGLGTAAFMVFIMRTCKPDYKAAHMSIATSIMSISATLAGVFSGFLASWIGFPLFFGFTFLATIPSMSLIPFLPHLSDSKK
jgi:PAT family beta-lactamase induction signal transducer AmpG